MPTEDRIERLRELADYRAVRGPVRRSAVGSLIFGGLTILAGLMSPVDPFLTGAGAILVGIGLWNFFAPRATGIAVDGLLLILIGGYNLSGIFINVTQGETIGTGLWVKVGILQVIWGVQSFWRFLQFHGAFGVSATETELLELDDLAAAIWMTRVKPSPDTIGFVTTGLGTVRWKARLDPDAAVLVTNGGTRVRVCARNAFEIEDLGETMTGRSRRVRIHLGEKAWKGAIGSRSFERFEQWKATTAVPEDVAA